MQTTQSSYVRQNFSEVIDTVVREKPIMVKRNRDSVLFMSEDQMIDILKNCYFTASYIKEADGSVTGVLEGFDIVVNAANEEIAKEKLAKELQTYAEEYYANFQQYYNTPNLRHHFPYIMRVILIRELEEIKCLIKK